MKTKRAFGILMARVVAKGARVLHMVPPAVATFTVSVSDGEKVVDEGYRCKSNSWVRNFLNYMACHALLGVQPGDGTNLFQDGYLNARRLDGSIVDKNSTDAEYSTGSYGASGIAYSPTIYNASADIPPGAGDPNGIVVGTSDAAESLDTYALGAQIEHGGGAGQLFHNAQVSAVRSWNSDARKWKASIVRTYTNTSEASITVKEIGYRALISKKNYSSIILNWGSQAANKNGLLIIRDVLPSPVTINKGQTLTVTYNLEYAF